MDYHTSLVAEFCHVTVDQTGGSSHAMETLGFIKSLDSLFSKLEELNSSMSMILCTDRNLSVAKVIREEPKYANVVHEYDIWHLGKSIRKKVIQASRQRNCGLLTLWSKSIVNHFWYCAQSCNGDPDVLVRKWKSLIRHISNDHEQCEHDNLSQQEASDKAWVTEGSSAFFAVQRIVLDKSILSAMKKCRHFIHTSVLESFHNILLKYMPKRLNFWKKSTRMRMQLAIMDHNFNVGRGFLGKKWPSYSKITKSIKHRNVFEKKTYDWRSVVMNEILSK